MGFTWKIVDLLGMHSAEDALTFYRYQGAWMWCAVAQQEAGQTLM
jgi:hypothetical protein